MSADANTGARRAMIAKVHIARKELALAPESYEAILMRIAGEKSAAFCTDAQLDAVLAEFKRLGWKPKTKAPAGGVPHVRKIKALWRELTPHLAAGEDSPRALNTFVKRQTGIDRAEWLDAKQANKVIEGLKAWLARVSPAT